MTDEYTDIAIYMINGKMMVFSKDLASHLNVSHPWLIDFMIHHGILPQISLDEDGHKSIDFLWLTKKMVSRTINTYIEKVILGSDESIIFYHELQTGYLKIFNDAEKYFKWKEQVKQSELTSEDLQNAFPSLNMEGKSNI